MGPPPFGDGKNLVVRITGNTASLLQWGHRLSAMESVRNSTSAVVLARASMGPPPFGDGKSTRLQERAEVQKLQWGHRLSAMESHGDLEVAGGSTSWASMGPPPFGDGKSQPGADRTQAATSTSRRFNGATAFRRWKATLGRRAIPALAVTASMGPPPFGDGKRLQWRDRSMGPPPFGDRGGIRTTERFNGATAFRRWKGLFANLFRRILMLKCEFPQETIDKLAGRTGWLDSVSPCSS